MRRVDLAAQEPRAAQGQRGPCEWLLPFCPHPVLGQAGGALGGLPRALRDRAEPRAPGRALSGPFSLGPWKSRVSAAFVCAGQRRPVHSCRAGPAPCLDNSPTKSVWPFRLRPLDSAPALRGLSGLREVPTAPGQVRALAKHPVHPPPPSPCTGEPSTSQLPAGGQAMRTPLGAGAPRWDSACRSLSSGSNLHKGR